MPIRADDEIRTRDPHLGKVMLYQLSHIRVVFFRRLDNYTGCSDALQTERPGVSRLAVNDPRGLVLDSFAMGNSTFGTASFGETALAYLWAVLLFVMFAAALLVPIFWLGSNLKDHWREYSTRKRVRVITGYLAAIIVIGLALWRGAMPSNF